MGDHYLRGISKQIKTLSVLILGSHVEERALRSNAVAVHTDFAFSAENAALNVVERLFSFF